MHPSVHEGHAPHGLLQRQLCDFQLAEALADRVRLIAVESQKIRLAQAPQATSRVAHRARERGLIVAPMRESIATESRLDALGVAAQRGRADVANAEGRKQVRESALLEPGDAR